MCGNGDWIYCMWYVSESRLSIQIQISLSMNITYMYALIGIMHMTNGRVLDRATFDTSTVKYQEESLNPSYDTLRPRIGPLDL